MNLLKGLLVLCLAFSTARAFPTAFDLDVSKCYEYTWACYGAHTSLDIFPRTTSGPLLYVDGQSTTTTSGRAAELEYVADVTGVEVRFLILELAEPTSEFQLRITHQFSHIAQTTGLIKVPIDLEVSEKARIGFEVQGEVVPIKYRENEGYMSLASPERKEGGVLTFDPVSVNRQYNFRLCLKTGEKEVPCPEKPGVRVSVDSADGAAERLSVMDGEDDSYPAQPLHRPPAWPLDQGVAV